MLKALLKKQLLEVTSFTFQNRKTGRRRTGAALAGFLLLYAALFALLASVVYSLAEGLAQAMFPLGLGWLYFALLSLLALLMGVFGSVFTAYTGLYQAKDNELLLAMPIPPWMILFVRMLGVYELGLVFSGVIYLPAWAASLICGSPGAAGVIFSALLFPLIGVLVLVLSCLCGWVVALAAARVRNKSAAVLVCSLTFLGLYYWGCMHYYDAIQQLLLHLEEIGTAVKGRALPLYLLGRAAEGDGMAMLAAAACIAALLAVLWVVMSRSFMHMLLHPQAARKAVYKEKNTHAAGMEAALLRKEWQRFTASATYMLNCALGTVMLSVGTVVVFVLREQVRDELALYASLGLGNGIPVLVAASLCGMSMMNSTALPSISLEGRSLWILQSLPAAPALVLRAKQRLQLLLTVPFVLVFTFSLGYVLELGVWYTLLIAAEAAAFCWFAAAAALILGLLRPTLTWTNETAPIKQSLTMLVYIFGGILLSLGLGAGGLRLCSHGVAPAAILAAETALLTAAAVLARRWLSEKGAERFAAL